MSYEKSDIRKDLESIQSILQNPSPMAGTSLASQVNCASLESGGASGGLSRSPLAGGDHQSSHYF